MALCESLVQGLFRAGVLFDDGVAHVRWPDHGCILWSALKVEMKMSLGV